MKGKLNIWVFRGWESDSFACKKINAFFMMVDEVDIRFAL